MLHEARRHDFLRHAHRGAANRGVLLRGRRAPGSAHFRSDARGIEKGIETPGGGSVHRHLLSPPRPAAASLPCSRPRTLTPCFERPRIVHLAERQVPPLTVFERGTDHGSHESGRRPMFEAAEVGRTLSKKAYKRRLPALRAALLGAQQQLRTAPFPVLVVFAGVDGAGKSETVNLLNAWMDPRWMVTRAFGDPSDEERERPEQWRFWRELPAQGRLGFFLNSWYSRPLSSIASTAALSRRRVRLPARRDRRVRADARRRWRADREVLDAPRQASRSSSGSKKLNSDPLTRWRVTSAAMEELEDLRPVHRGRRADDPRDQHRPCALDDRRGAATSGTAA